MGKLYYWIGNYTFTGLLLCPYFYSYLNSMEFHRCLPVFFQLCARISQLLNNDAIHFFATCKGYI